MGPRPKWGRGSSRSGGTPSRRRSGGAGGGLTVESEDADFLDDFAIAPGNSKGLGSSQSMVRPR